MEILPCGSGPEVTEVQLPNDRRELELLPDNKRAVEKNTGQVFELAEYK